MSQANVVNMLTYQVALTAENAGKIDQINKILLGSVATESAPTKQPEAKKSAPASDTSSGASDSVASMDDLKAAAKKAKTDHGEQFVKDVMESLDIKPLASLGRCMSKIPAEQYDTIIPLWEAGPVVTVGDDDDLGADDLEDDLDDDLDADEPVEAVTAEAVKLALKAMSQGGDRDGAKALMAEFKAPKLSDVDGLSAAVLAKLFAKLV